MNKAYSIFIAGILMLFTVSCKEKKLTDTDMEGSGYVKAMVISYEVDGCGYMLELTSDKSKLEPDGLQPEFQKDSLPVWIKYKAAPDRMSICMAGQTIDLLEIKKR